MRPAARGPSPRVRGNRPDSRLGCGAPGSIPASAGKPSLVEQVTRRIAVHPRECGETDHLVTLARAVAGPSPRVRGNPMCRSRSRRAARSIPASAGKPASITGSNNDGRVHPRECGETYRPRTAHRWNRGPSPRVRENRRTQDPGAARARSIPASAGKPSCPRCGGSGRRVHPRECGETLAALGPYPHAKGPSPRVRGNLRHHRATYAMDGSIPASAGKPLVESRYGVIETVHPRECGETAAPSAYVRVQVGPSPRVRGNRIVISGMRDTSGSIPASAGKPSSGCLIRLADMVHPRECGETRLGEHLATLVGGPSPRVRGNLIPWPDRHRA